MNDTLPPRERVAAALSFNEVRPVPYTLPIEQEAAAKLDLHYGNREWRTRIVNHIEVVRLPKLGVLPGEGPLYTDPFGVTWRTDTRPYHQERPALSEPELGGYSWPEANLLWDEAAVRTQIEQARQRGAYIVASTGFGLFERSWTLRGIENALTDMLLNSRFYHDLLDGILEILLQMVQRFAALPVDGIMLSDDWGDQRGVIMGPRLWRKFLQPRAKLFNDAVHAAGKTSFQHCCGNVFSIIPEMITGGLDVLESLQIEAMDVYEIKRCYGRELRLWGGLGTQQLLPFGTPDQIRAEVRRLSETLGAGGGYVLAPAKPLMSEVPARNAAAVLEAFTGTSSD